MISYVSDLFKGLLDLVYPPLCEICEAKLESKTKNSGLCGNCLNEIKLINNPTPLKCNDLNVWAVCLYEGTAKKCIHLFKYNSRLNLAAPLSKLMFDFINKNMGCKNFDAIIPVPLHRSRLRERGFNQAEVLARKLSGYTRHSVCTNALKRVKPTLSQTGLCKTKRFTNLQGAFKITKGGFVSGKKILLIDDVFTTGSTINEAAKTLLKAGAESVEALVLARGI